MEPLLEALLDDQELLMTIQNLHLQSGRGTHT